MTAVFSSTSQMMRQVIYALVLGISAAYAFFENALPYYAQL
jgi:uncharacterized membrane protein YuzA (DUF378 family)